MRKASCEHCQTVLSVPDEAVGKRVKCPKCGQVFRIESARIAAPEPLPTPTVAARKPARTQIGAVLKQEKTFASNPGGVTLSPIKLTALYPDFFTPIGRLKRLLGFFGNNYVSSVGQMDSHLRLGDSRAAVVISVSPLLVAAYTDEFDCVAMLKFPEPLVALYGLKRGAPLLTVNTYMRGPRRLVADLIEGPGSLGNWHNFMPFIADFLSDDIERIEQRKREISREEWERAMILGVEYLRARPGKARDGRPMKCHWPCITSWF